ncbi:MAG: PEP-utilizing enzyme, partial [Desulfovibrionales bacterium]
STGGGSGPVFVLKQMADVNTIPEDSVAVVPWLDPSLSQIVDRVAAVISQEGSRACHFASVAREFNLPVVYGIKNLEVLKEDQVVTVDADGGLVLSGRIEALLEEKKNRQQSRLAERLRHVMPQMITLNLTDHTAPSFSPEGCKSLHDIVRFVHEKSVQEMFTMVGKGSRAMNRAKRLKTELPLVMYVLDIEEGLFASARESDAITADDIKSSPMTALWWGLSSQDVVWDDSQLYMDWEEFDRISAGVFKKDSPLLASYAILAEDYAHVMVRFGYHFSIVDTLCGKDQKNNYINFRFKGWGGTPHQRNFRLQFIRGVLEPFDFQLTTRGDLLDASIRSLEEPSIHRRLAVLGYLLAKTRLMDFTLENETQVQDEIRDFLLKIRKRAL